MIGETACHRRTDLPMVGAQLLVGPAHIVGHAQEEHTRTQGLKPTCRMSAFAGQLGQTLSHRAIQALNVGRVEDLAS